MRTITIDLELRSPMIFIFKTPLNIYIFHEWIYLRVKSWEIYKRIEEYLQNLQILVTCKQHDVQFFLTEINFFIFFCFFFWQQMCQSYLFSLYINFFPQSTFFHSYKKHGSRNAKTLTVQPRNKANRRRTPANLSTDSKKTLFSFSKQIKSSKNSWKFFIRKI